MIKKIIRWFNTQLFILRLGSLPREYYSRIELPDRMELLARKLGKGCLDGLYEHDMKLKRDVRKAINGQ